MYSHLVRLRHGKLLLPLGIVVLFVLSLLSLSARTVQAASSHVDVMVLNEDINPATRDFLIRAVNTAEHDGATALVIEVDTPGGDLDSMKAMVQAELSSTVPIISYVSPTGGRAASAGAFVALAAHIAAMAPVTRIGASSPITSTGADIGSTLKSKIENDLVQAITGIQKGYNRPGVAQATAMITQAASYTDTIAVSQGIVDLSARNLGDLLAKVNGKSIPLSNGGAATLQTEGVPIQAIDQSPADQAYYLLLDPNVLFLLFIVALVGIYVEISHPGVIFPGVVGSIALVLFLLGVGSISPNWAGLALMGLAFVLLVLDIRLTSHGVLTVGAVISLIFGALLFFNSGGPYNGQQVNPLVVYVMGAVIGALGLYIVSVVVRVRRRPVTTGTEGMIGSLVVAATPLLPAGRVLYDGEDWAAVLDGPATATDPGTELRIVAVEGLRLHVRPIVDTRSETSPRYLRGV